MFSESTGYGNDSNFQGLCKMVQSSQTAKRTIPFNTVKTAGLFPLNNCCVQQSESI